MTEAVLIESVRAEMGGVTVAMDEIDDTDIVRYGTKILNLIAEKITIKTLRYITSTEDERSYSVPSEVLRVQDVFPYVAVEDEYDFGQISLEVVDSGDYSIVNELNWPSLWKIKMMKKMGLIMHLKWDFDPINRKLNIDPAPAEDDLLFYYFSVDKTKWTLDLLPEDFEEMVIVGTAWKSLSQVALKRSNLGGVMREGGKVTYPSTELRLFIQDKKDEFDDYLRIKSMIYSR